MFTDKGKCHLCGRPLQETGGLNICPPCNDSSRSFYDVLNESISIFAEDTDKVMIECPGATLYIPGTNEVAAGVKFHDPNDPSKGHEIIKHPVFGPRHVKRRRIKKEDARLIRRCQSCQDHTVRMRRKEGPDLYIPSLKNPRPPAQRQHSRPRSSR